MRFWDANNLIDQDDSEGERYAIAHKDISGKEKGKDHSRTVVLLHKFEKPSHDCFYSIIDFFHGLNNPLRGKMRSYLEMLRSESVFFNIQSICSTTELWPPFISNYAFASESMRK